MKIILLLFIVFSAFLYAEDYPEIDKSQADSLTINNAVIRDDWFSADKGQHFAGSFMATGLATLSGRRFLGFDKQKSRMIGVSFSLSLALGKELYDSGQPDNHFSRKDLTADLLGIILAILVFR